MTNGTCSEPSSSSTERKRQRFPTKVECIVAIDDEIDAARVQIEYGKASVAPKVVTTILKGLAAVGVTPAKPAAFLMKKVFEQREDNTLYLLEATISKLRRLEEQFRTFSASHKQFVEEQLPRLLVEAVSKAERTGSKERIERLSLIIVHTVVEGPSADLETVDEMMRVTVGISDVDISVLAQIYSVQGQELARTGFLPEMNLANRTWKDLQTAFPIFRSSEIHSICAKLQSLGLVTQVPRIATTLDLTSIPYTVLRKGAEYLELLGKSYTATIIG